MIEEWNCLSHQKAVSEDKHINTSTSCLAKLTKAGMIKTKNQNLLPQLKKGMALLSVLANFKVDIEFSNSLFLHIEIGDLPLICDVIRCKSLCTAQGNNRISSFRIWNLDIKTAYMRRCHSTHSFSIFMAAERNC